MDKNQNVDPDAVVNSIQIYTMKKILVLCTGNSCRSQMAEGFLTYYAKKLNKNIEVISAGVETHGVNPRAILVMKEKGIDISKNTSDHVDKYLNYGISHLISVCDHAIESCPVFPENVNHTHHTFYDPSKTTGTNHQILESFRKTRDEIELFCKEYILKYFQNE